MLANHLLVLKQHLGQNRKRQPEKTPDTSPRNDVWETTAEIQITVQIDCATRFASANRKHYPDLSYKNNIIC